MKKKFDFFVHDNHFLTKYLVSILGFGWVTINFKSVRAYGLIDGSRCDIALTNSCDPYVKLYIDGVQVLQTEAQENACCYNVDTKFVSKKVAKTSKIRIEVWDDDSGAFFSSPDDLILQAEGDVDSFRDEPIRHGSTFMGYTSSIEISLSWQDEYV